jgi:hypothetical protein
MQLCPEGQVSPAQPSTQVPPRQIWPRSQATSRQSSATQRPVDSSHVSPGRQGAAPAVQAATHTPREQTSFRGRAEAVAVVREAGCSRPSIPLQLSPPP